MWHMYIDLQYSAEVLLNEKCSQHYTDDGVSKVWLAVRTNQKYHHEPSHCEQHPQRLCVCVE